MLGCCAESAQVSVRPTMGILEGRPKRQLVIGIQIDWNVLRERAHSERPSRLKEHADGLAGDPRLWLLPAALAASCLGHIRQRFLHRSLA